MSLSPPGAVTHHNVTILCVPAPAMLDALLLRPELRAWIWCRLDDTRALVDSGRLQTLQHALASLGSGYAMTEGTLAELEADR